MAILALHILVLVKEVTRCTIPVQHGCALLLFVGYGTESQVHTHFKRPLFHQIFMFSRSCFFLSSLVVKGRGLDREGGILKMWAVTCYIKFSN